MAGGIQVEGLVELNRALRRTDKDVRLGIRRELRSVAEPVKADAEALAVGRITNIGVEWSRMRIGQTAHAVYVVPKQRGVKSRARQKARRPNLKTLLLDRAMEPALARNANRTEREFSRMLDRVADNFSR